jgi:hypothetical protein
MYVAISETRLAGATQYVKIFKEVASNLILKKNSLLNVAFKDMSSFYPLLLAFYFLFNNISAANFYNHLSVFISRLFICLYR